MTAALAQFAVSTVASDDLELVHASKEGDVSAFEQLVWRYDRGLLEGLGKENMKRFSKYLVGLLLGLSLVVSALPCQEQDSDRVNVTIPFDFVVAAKQLKAGDYVIESLHDNETLRFRREGGDVQQIVFTVPIEANPSGNHERLLFHHDGDKYFLSQVWFWGDEDGRELIPGIQEKSVGKSRPVSGQTVVGQ